MDFFIPILTNCVNDFFLLGLSIFIFALAITLNKHKLQRISVYLILSAITSGIIFITIKILTGELRPFLVLENVNQLVSVGSPLTFPSGHTTSAFAFASTIALTYKIKIKNFNFNSGWIAYPIAIFMGVSRIYVGVHYPLDVLVGAIIGFLSAYTVIKLGDKYLKDNICSLRITAAVILILILYICFIYVNI